MKNIDYHNVRRWMAALVAMMLLPATLLQAQQSDTSCAPQTLPWSTSFEVETRLPSCWTAMAEVSVYPFVYPGGYASSGNYSLALYAEGTGSCMAASPLMAHRADSLHVGFHLVMNDGYGQLQVGLVADTADTATFVPLLTLDLSTAASGYYEFYTDGFTAADTQAVAFRLVNGRVTVDDLEVEAATTCRRPWQPQVGAVTHNSIALSWGSPGAVAPAYLVRYIASDTAYQTVYTTQVLLGGLTPATAYRIDVAALCNGDTTAWMPAGVITTDVACRQPLAFEVEASTASAAVLHWTHGYDGYIAPTAARLALQDITAGLPVGAPASYTGSHAFLSNLTAGHHYQATLQAICQNDTSLPLTVGFTPLADPCVEHAGTVASSVLPLGGANRYNYSQMLYPKAVLAGVDSLYAIAFRVEENRMTVSRRLDLYIGAVADSALAGNVSSVLLTHVCDSAVIPAGAEGWMVFPLANPVAVDTTQNFLVAVLDNTAIPTGLVRFGTHIEPYGSSLYTSSQTLPIPHTDFNIPMYSLSQVADIQIYGNCAMSACQPPAAAVTAVTDSSITVGWAGGSDSIAVRYRVAGIEEINLWQGVLAHAATSVVIGGLNASTQYELEVASECGTETVFGHPFTALTSCATVDVPYYAGFADGLHPCWTGGEWRGSNGVGIEVPLVSPEVNAALSTLQVRLAVRAAEPWDIIRVGVTATDAAQAVWVDSVAASEVVGGEWVAYLDGYTGNARHVVIQGTAGFLLSEAVIEPLDECLPPRNMHLSAVMATGTTLSWSGTAGNYLVTLMEEGSDAISSWTTAASQYSFSGLAPQTSYVGYVRSLCSDNVHSRPAWFRVSTGCGNISTFPYTMGFEPSETSLACWTPVYSDPACGIANPIITTTDRRFTGMQSLRFSSYNNLQSGNYGQYIISPRIVATDSIWVSFRYYKENYDSEPFQVGFSTYGNAVSDFLWMGVVEPQAGQWMQYEIGFPASTRYVAINYMGQGNYYLYIDELAIRGPGCAAPQITMVDEQADNITIRWDVTGDTSYVAITSGIWLSNVEGEAVTDGVFTFSSLESSNYYTIGVRSRCPDGHLSDWTTRRVSTINPNCLAPTGLQVDTIGFTDAVISWTPDNDGQLWQLAVISDGDLIYQSGRLSEPSCMLVGLDQNMTYNVIVRSYCSDIPGPWSDTLQFTTAECMPVSDLEYERIDFRTVVISWTEAPVTTGYCRLEYGPQGFTPGTGSVIQRARTPFRLEYLDPYTDYDVYVRNHCEANVQSDSIAFINVPNGVGIDDAPDMAGISIYPNPAEGDITVSVDTPVMLNVMDISGREVISPVYVVSSYVIPHATLPTGTYFVRLTWKDSTVVGKLIVK